MLKFGFIVFFLHDKYVCLCVCVCMRRPEENLGCHFSDAIKNSSPLCVCVCVSVCLSLCLSLSVCLCFRDRVSHSPAAYQWASLAGQWAPETCLSPPPHYWDYRWCHRSWHFYLGSHALTTVLWLSVSLMQHLLLETVENSPCSHIRHVSPFFWSFCFRKSCVFW